MIGLFWLQWCWDVDGCSSILYCYCTSRVRLSLPNIFFSFWWPKQTLLLLMTFAIHIGGIILWVERGNFCYQLLKAGCCQIYTQLSKRSSQAVYNRVKVTHHFDSLCTRYIYSYLVGIPPYIRCPLMTPGPTSLQLLFIMEVVPAIGTPKEYPQFNSTELE